MIEGKTRLYGLIGYPVKHSFSPLMHNAAFGCLKINAEYRLFEIKPGELEDFLLKDSEVKDIEGNSFSSRDIAGFNVTIPHKVKAREILEEKFPFDKDAPLINRELFYVKLSGAINTVKRIGEKLEYYNTDAEGFIKSLQKNLKFDTKDKNVLLFGCGGAGRAIIAGLSWRQLEINKIYVYDINPQAVNSANEHFSKALTHLKNFLSNKIEFISAEQIPEIIKDCQLLVDASGTGLKKEDISIIDKKLLHKNLFVYDLVYNKKTRLLREARSMGCRGTEGGLGMLLYQGELSFGLWTARHELAIEKAMKQALQKAVRRQCSKR